MADLIDRQKIKARFEPWLKVKDYSEGELNMLKAVLYEITVMPSAERHGRTFTEDELKELIERIKQEPPMLFALPPEDMVKVVRCKDCIHYEAKQKNQPWKSSRKYCNRQVILCTEPNDFCSYGERKTDGSD